MSFIGDVTYDYLSEQSYEEKGAVEANLEVEQRTSHLLRTKVGMTFAADMRLDQGALYLFVSPSWVRKIALSNGKMRAKLQEFTSAPCLLVVDTFDGIRDLVAVDVGFSYTAEDRVYSLVYRGEFGHRYYVHQIEGTWEWVF